MRDIRVTAHIELESPRNHDDGLGPMSILEQREPERFCPVDEQATATVLFVLNNPIAVAVLTDKEEVRSRRGRFLLAHDTFPSCSCEARSAARQQRSALLIEGAVSRSRFSVRWWRP
jgi:hypothetical protein